jgi:flagellar hook-associated protein 1 FlgK
VSLDASLAIAGSGLANVNRQMAVVSQNVANASTPDYVRQVSTQTSLVAGGQGMGVRTGQVQRALDAALQAALFQQNGAVAGLQTREAALAAIDAVQGTPGQGNDLASLLGKLQDGFSSLAGDPSNVTQQAAVAGDAAALAGQINAVSAAYSAGRNAAQAAIVAGVGTLNTTLAKIGGLSDQIVQLRALGQSTADVENQRDAAVDQLSGLIELRGLAQPNGDLLLVTASGLSLPTHAASPPFATSAATLGAGSYAPGGGVPAITLGGQDVTARLSGGSLGANITLRDSTLPAGQAQLDEFAETLSQRFAQQGLRLFTDASGTVPARTGAPAQNGYIGYASAIQVNPAVAASPALLRDGTDAVAGSPTGASAFTPNPSGGPAGFTGLLQRVLNFALGAEAQPGVAQPAPATSGLGPSGLLSAPYAPPATLAGFATAMVAAQARDSAAASTALGNETAVQTALQGKFTSASGVSMDSEMSTMIQLQGSYGANAKLIAAVQAMWNQTLQMVQ